MHERNRNLHIATPEDLLVFFTQHWTPIMLDQPQSQEKSLQHLATYQPLSHTCLPSLKLSMQRCTACHIQYPLATSDSRGKQSMHRCMRASAIRQMWQLSMQRCKSTTAVVVQRMLSSSPVGMRFPTQRNYPAAAALKHFPAQQGRPAAPGMWHS